MKTLKLLALAACAFLFSQCKTTAPTAPTGPAPSLFEVEQVLDTAHSIFYESAKQTNGDPFKAIELTAGRLAIHALVKSAESEDSAHIEIVLKSGLRTIYVFNPIDSGGYSIFRGGGKPTSGTEVTLTTKPSAKKISNKKVLIYGGAFKEFYHPGEMEKITSMLSQSPVKLEVTLLKDEQCGYQLVENFKDYGLVILDTHGEPDEFRTGVVVKISDAQRSTSTFHDLVIEQLGPDAYTKLLSGELVIGSQEDVSETPDWWNKKTGGLKILNIWITTKYIDELPYMPETVIFANTCNSGYQRPLQSGNIPYQVAFMGKYPISYYGYAYPSGRSDAVDDVFAKAMENNFVRRLTIDLDSTQIIHLDANGKESFDQRLADDTHGRSLLYFKHFGADNYSYPQNCGDPIIDSRDGQSYATVCIGNQTWMAENLRYNAAGSSDYEGNSANSKIYGKLYDWASLTGNKSSSASPSGVQGICPKGWHIPSYAEWTTLINNAGGWLFAGGALKSTSSLWMAPNTGAQDLYGFSALAGGEYNTDLSGYYFQTVEGHWWTTTLGTNPGKFNCIIMYHDSPQIPQLADAPPTDLKSCRCVKDP